MPSEPEDENVAMLGYFGLAFVVTIILAWVSTASWVRYLTTSYALVFVSSVVLLILGWKLGHRGGHRRRIAGLIAIFFSLVLIFAIVHACLFRYEPDSYRISDALLGSRIRDELQSDRARIREYAQTLFVATLIETRAAAVYAAIARARDLNHFQRPAQADLGAGFFFNCQVTLDPTGEGLPLTPLQRMWIVKIADHSRSDGDLDYTGHRLTWNRFVLAASAARSADSLRQMSRILAADVQRLQERTVVHMRDVTLQKSQLDMSHYIYFSATIMTTIGSADLTPASRNARWLTTFQAFVAIFFHGYAVNVLWPERGKT